MKLTLETQPDDVTHLGLEIASGENDSGMTFSVASTGRRLIARITKDGRTVSESADLQPMLEAWLDHLEERLNGGDSDGAQDQGSPSTSS